MLDLGWSENLQDGSSLGKELESPGLEHGDYGVFPMAICHSYQSSHSQPVERRYIPQISLIVGNT